MLVSNRVRNLHPYVPGEQPADRDYVKLNANENPYPPSPEVARSLADFITASPEKMGLYPDPDSNALCSAIASMLNRTGGVLCRCSADINGVVSPAPQDKIGFEITPDMIYAGNGSDEVLSFAFYAFFDPSRPFVTARFTYSFYPVYAGFYDLPMDAVPLNSDWSLDTDEMVRRASKNHGGMIFANPNAPTGLSLSREQIRRMLLQTDSNDIFIVDEAYADFGGESCIPLLAEFKNLVIVRTFSKSLCAAGQRLGYLVASPELVKVVTSVKNSVNHFPIDVLTQVAGAAACRNPAYYADCAKKVCASRDSFQDFLTASGFSVVPSSTNFIFARHPKISGERLYKSVKNEGILIRHFNTPGIEQFVRISVGTPQQMSLLKDALEKILREGA